MQLKEVLLKHVNSYHIHAKSIVFWAPYLRNDNYSQDSNVPRGLGKATPEEIRESAEFILSTFPGADIETVRKKLIDGSLTEAKYNFKAVDCSGFAFHVLDRTYREIFDKSLVSDLSVPKDHVLNGALRLDEWRAAYEISEDEANALPEDVPMTWVVEKFKRRPQNLCRVKSLVSDYSSVPIKLEDLRSGDLIYMNIPGDPVPHVVIVLNIIGEGLEIAHSLRRSPEEIGGVAIETINLKDGKLDTSNMRVPHVVVDFRRLKTIAGL